MFQVSKRPTLDVHLIDARKNTTHMSTNALFTIQMSFPFSFRLSVPGISNPFLNSSPPPRTARAGGKQPFEASHLDAAWTSSAPIYRRRPSPGPAPAPLVRKRGWVPSTAEPSRAAVVSTSTTGFLDTPAKYRDMSVVPNEGEDNEEVVVDLPLSKRRKGITGSVISTAFSAALIGAAAGLTVYRMWRDRGKEAEQMPPPPPYQEEWHPVTPPEPQTVQTSPQPLQRSRTNPTTHKRHTTIVRNRQKVTIARKTARVIKDTSPKKPSLQIQQPVFQEHVEIEDQDDCKDEMDWIGDKLSQLIEEGKRALGKEIVVSSDAPEDEVDDGSGNWIEDEPQASTSYAHYTPGANFSSPTKRNRHRYTNSVSTLTPPRRSAVSLHSRFNSEGSGMLTNPRSPNQSTSFAPETSFSSNIGDSENEWASPHIRESMERARAAYRQKRGLDS